MELQIKPYEKAQPIEWNYEAIKAELSAKLELYKNQIYTPELITAAKTDRANLNNLKKALNDERIRREREFNEPFQVFKNQIKEICEMIDEPVRVIDAQIKEVEEKEKREKREKCLEIFNGIEHPGWLKYEQIENAKWYNKTTSIKAITEEIEAKINHVNVDIQMLSALPDFSFEAIEVYKETLDSGKALVEGNRLADIQKRKEAAKTPDIPFAGDEVVEITTDETKGEIERVWLSFKAYVSKSEALELKAFFNAMGIQYEAIRG